MDYKVVFVHGLYGSSNTDFFPSLREDFKKNDIDFDCSDFPGGFLNAFPKAEDWVEKIDAIVSGTDKPVILVGYSLGTRAVLLYLDKFRKKVAKVILISCPPNTTLAALAKQGRVRSFFRYRIDTNALKSFADKFVVVHSKDDPSTRYEWGVSLSKALGAEMITYADKGHFNIPGCAEEVISIVKKEL